MGQNFIINSVSISTGVEAENLNRRKVNCAFFQRTLEKQGHRGERSNDDFRGYTHYKPVFAISGSVNFTFTDLMSTIR